MNDKGKGWLSACRRLSFDLLSGVKMKLVVFDIDGTLTRTSDVDDVCFIPTLREYFGRSDFDTDWSAYPHVSDSGILDSLSRRFHGRPATDEEAASFESAFMARLREQPASEFQALLGATDERAVDVRVGSHV